MRRLSVVLFLISLYPSALFAQSSSASIEGTGTELEVLAVRDSVSGDWTQEPVSGKKFISVEMGIDNRNGSEAINSSFLKFRLKSPAGYVYRANLSSLTEPRLPASDLEPGEFVRGWVDFEIPVATNVGHLRIRYETIREKSGWMSLRQAESSLDTEASTSSDQTADTGYAPTVLEIRNEDYMTLTLKRAGPVLMSLEFSSVNRHAGHICEISAQRFGESVWTDQGNATLIFPSLSDKESFLSLQTRPDRIVVDFAPLNRQNHCGLNGFLPDTAAFTKEDGEWTGEMQ